eukprot:1010382-Pleurochrysis_carterae.AAC.3
MMTIPRPSQSLVVVPRPSLHSVLCTEQRAEPVFRPNSCLQSALTSLGQKLWPNQSCPNNFDVAENRADSVLYIRRFNINLYRKQNK